MKKRLIAAILLAVLPTIGHADASADQDRTARGETCINAGRLDRIRRIDDQTVILRSSPSKRYRVTLKAPCRELRFHRPVTLNGGTCIHRGDRLVVHRPEGFKQYCVIDSIEFIPPDGAS